MNPHTQEHSGHKPRAGLKTGSILGFDIPVFTLIMFLVSSAGLIVASVPLPGYVDRDWLPAFIGIGVLCLLLAALAAAGFLSGLGAMAVMASADVNITVAIASLSDRSAGGVVAALFALPTIYIAIFFSYRWLITQAAVVLVCAWIIVNLVPAPTSVHVIRALVILTGVMGPALIVLITTQRLDQAVTLAENLATTDPLTGLLNRRGLEERFPALAARAARAGTPVGVIVADVDHFKRVNDVHGHLVGDEVLIVIAKAVLASMRGEELAVRTGGEEVVVVALAHAGEINDLAERLRARVQVAGAAWGVTISAGVTSVEVFTGDDPNRLLWSAVDAADDAMYEAKRAGRNLVRVTA